MGASRRSRATNGPCLGLRCPPRPTNGLAPLLARDGDTDHGWWLGSLAAGGWQRALRNLEAVARRAGDPRHVHHSRRRALHRWGATAPTAVLSLTPAEPTGRSAAPSTLVHYQPDRSPTSLI
eukprot:2137014-Prymnesium_polylepis.3